MIWFLRMARWVRHPPSEGRVKLILGVIAAVFALWGVEQILGWPQGLGLEPSGRFRP